MGGSKKLVGKHLEDALAMLQAVTSILKEQQIPYCLDAGTLLGVMREKRLLPWDTDMDLAISAQYWDDLCAARKHFHRAGYITRVRTTTMAVGPLAKGRPRLLRVYTRKWLFFKHEQLMDIFIKYKAGDQYFWTVDSHNPIVQSCPASFLERLVPHQFNGGTYLIPEEYDACLTHHYGNWREVRKDWNFRQEDRSNTNSSAWTDAVKDGS